MTPRVQLLHQDISGAGRQRQGFRSGPRRRSWPSRRSWPLCGKSDERVSNAELARALAALTRTAAHTRTQAHAHVHAPARPAQPTIKHAAPLFAIARADQVDSADEATNGQTMSDSSPDATDTADGPRRPAMDTLPSPAALSTASFDLTRVRCSSRPSPRAARGRRSV